MYALIMGLKCSIEQRVNALKCASLLGQKVKIKNEKSDIQIALHRSTKRVL